MKTIGAMILTLALASPALATGGVVQRQVTIQRVRQVQPVVLRQRQVVRQRVVQPVLVQPIVTQPLVLQQQLYGVGVQQLFAQPAFSQQIMVQRICR